MTRVVSRAVLRAGSFGGRADLMGGTASRGTLWGGTPPSSEGVTVRNYIKRLRQKLGYQIEAATDEIDLLAFTRLCEDGRMAAAGGDWYRHASDNHTGCPPGFGNRNWLQDENGGVVRYRTRALLRSAGQVATSECGFVS
jgi:hypothetical protein